MKHQGVDILKSTAVPNFALARSATAKAALVDGLLKFPGEQIYNGPDAATGLGIIVVSPNAGADCEFVVAKVFGWGK